MDRFLDVKFEPFVETVDKEDVVLTVAVGDVVEFIFFEIVDRLEEFDFTAVDINGVVVEFKVVVKVVVIVVVILVFTVVVIVVVKGEVKVEVKVVVKFVVEVVVNVVVKFVEAGEEVVVGVVTIVLVVDTFSKN
jgi:hypothetical protein